MHSNTANILYVLVPYVCLENMGKRETIWQPQFFLYLSFLFWLFLFKYYVFFLPPDWTEHEGH